MNTDELLSSRLAGSVEATVSHPAPSRWVIAADGLTRAIDSTPATAGWGFVIHRIGVLEGLECEYWGGRFCLMNVILGL